MPAGDLEFQKRKQFEAECRDEFLSVIRISSHQLSLPLYLGFWALDWLYAPKLVWLFLALRSLVIPMNFIIQKLLKKVSTLEQAQWLACLHILCDSLIITSMILLVGDSGSLYYAGLNLVGAGAIDFFPWRKKFIPLVIGLVYGPYLIFGLASLGISHQRTGFIVNLSFIVGTIVISLVIRRFNDKLRLRELDHRFSLDIELKNREKLVEEKTKEALKFKDLSRQFSPQIVHSISLGKMSLTEGVHRSNICAIFIDIVNSTQRIVRIDKDGINAVISQFMDDTMRTLIKYDITIDKFLGDGILAFANDPMPHPDYIERTVMAALDILDRLKKKQPFYQDHWLQEFQVRIGIASGFANVGFYGKNEIFRTYTGIGPVMNLAARLCAKAKPDTIIVSNEVRKKLEDAKFCHLTPLGNMRLKGFEDDLIKAFEVKETIYLKKPEIVGAAEECPKCKKIMHLDVDAKGFYIFRCRDCDSQIDDKRSTAA